MGDWSCPLTVRGVLRSMEFLFSLLVVAVGMGGWTCESSSAKNEFLVAVGIMYLVVSGGMSSRTVNPQRILAFIYQSPFVYSLHLSGGA